MKDFADKVQSGIGWIDRNDIKRQIEGHTDKMITDKDLKKLNQLLENRDLIKNENEDEEKEFENDEENSIN